MKLVAKIGGSLLKSPLPGKLLDELSSFSRSGSLVIVHGGGDIVTEFATKLGKEQRFVVSPEGIRSRFTDRETAEIYTMVMSGDVAKKLVLSLGERGVRAVGLSGLDGGLMRGRRKKKLVVVDERGRKVLIEGGYTGRVESVNAQLLELLISSGYLPIVSPVAAGDSYEPLNVDGDRAASSIAVGMKADAVVFFTNVDGLVLDGSVVHSITAGQARSKLREVGFGMQKKLIAAVEAVEGGVGRAIICSGRRDEAGR